MVVAETLMRRRDGRVAVKLDETLLGAPQHVVSAAGADYPRPPPNALRALDSRAGRERPALCGQDVQRVTVSRHLSTNQGPVLRTDRRLRLPTQTGCALSWHTGSCVRLARQPPLASKLQAMNHGPGEQPAISASATASHHGPQTKPRQDLFFASHSRRRVPLTRSATNKTER